MIYAYEPAPEVDTEKVNTRAVTDQDHWTAAEELNAWLYKSVPSQTVNCLRQLLHLQGTPDTLKVVKYLKNPDDLQMVIRLIKSDDHSGACSDPDQ